MKFIFLSNFLETANYTLQKQSIVCNSKVYFEQLLRIIALVTGEMVAGIPGYLLL